MGSETEVLGPRASNRLLKSKGAVGLALAAVALWRGQLELMVEGGGQTGAA